MNGNYDFYRIYLPEIIRNKLGINYKNKNVYLYIDSKCHLIVSSNRIPKNFKYITIKARIKGFNWTLPIPLKFLPEHKPGLLRYALHPIAPDEKTYQIVKISPRLFIKEKNNANTTPVSIRRCRKTKTLKLCRNLKPTKNGENPSLIDSLQ